MFLSTAAHPFSVLSSGDYSDVMATMGLDSAVPRRTSPDWRRLWILTAKIQKLGNSQLAPCTCTCWSCQVHPDQFPSSPLWVSGVISAAFRSIGLLDGAGYWVIVTSLRAVSRDAGERLLVPAPHI
ncbi:hypothetical protein J3459_008021 [Metarhizium acridum]|nr:hypothetical protein J3459_008021 [Metarhizium acridum]